MSDTIPEATQAGKHTPGPWVKGWYDDVLDEIVIQTYEGEYVASIDCDGAYEGRIAACIDANARLIAAAPDMLEALREARPYVPDHHGPVAYKVDAAIAKAEGKQ
jgi:hypothetical protein